MMAPSGGKTTPTRPGDGMSSRAGEAAVSNGEGSSIVGETPADDVSRSLAHLREVARETEAGLHGIATSLAPQREVETEIKRLLAQRDDAAMMLGYALLKAASAGFDLRVVRPEPEPEPSRPIEPVRAERISQPPPKEEPRREEPQARVAPEPAALVALASQGLGPQWSAPKSTSTDGYPRMQSILLRIGEPTQVANAEQTIAGLAEAAQHSEELATLPAELQRALLGWLSALARHIQDEISAVLSARADEQLRTVFSTLSRWSREHRPGFVPGLSRRNGPHHGTWLDDAIWWWEVLKEHLPEEEPDAEPSPPPLLVLRDLLKGNPSQDLLVRTLQAALDAGIHQTDARLVQMLAPHQDTIAALPGFKTLKAALKATSRPDDADALNDPGPEIVPDDWPLLSITQGKHAVILGGDRRPLAAERICTAFRFEDVAWETTDARRVSTLAERIRAKSIDLIILLRAYVGHAEQRVALEACRDAGVPYAVVDMGYGVSQVKRAIERYCARTVSAPSETADREP